MSDISASKDAAHFSTAVRADELWRHSLKSSAATLGAQVSSFLLRFGATLVLARILTPADYGVFAIAAAASGFVGLFRDLGLGQASVQGPTLSHDQVSTLFWINSAAGLGLTLLSAASAPLIGWLFGDARVAWAMLGLSVTHFLVGLMAQHHALLRRQLRLNTLAAVDTTAVLAGVLAAIFAARAGGGFWALVLMQCGIALVTTAAILVLCSWRPGAPVRGSGLAPMLALGRHVTAFGVSTYFARNADSLLIGRRFGPHSLGLYDKAYQLMLVPAQLVTLPLSSVAVSVLSRLQGDAARFRRYYRLFLGVSVGLGMPFTAFLFMTADRVIPLLLGPQWLPSVPLFRALAPAAFADALTLTISWIFVSLGRTGRQVGFSLAAAAVTVLAVVVALPFGPLGVAVAFSACRLALPLPSLIYTCRRTPLRWTEPLALAALPAAAALLAAALLALLEPRLPLAEGAAGVLRAALAYGLLYALLAGAGWLLARSVLATQLRPEEAERVGHL